MPRSRPNGDVRVIAPRVGRLRDRVAENWERRNLVRYFAHRFNEKRYLRTWLGPLWIVLRPVLSIGVQVMVFSAILGVHTGAFPYLVVFTIGYTGWYLFSETAYWATRSLELNRSILRHMYVPRGTMLVAAAAPAIVDALVAAGVLVCTLVGYAIADDRIYLDTGPARILLLVPALAVLTAWGITVGAWLAVPGARARDVRFGLRFALNAWFYLTPVAYPSAKAADRLGPIVDLNPITAPIGATKYALLGYDAPSGLAIASSLGLLAVFGVAGALVFFRAETAATDHL